jgi:O-antigen ligase
MLPFPTETVNCIDQLGHGARASHSNSHFSRSEGNTTKVIAWIFGAAFISTIFQFYSFSIGGTYPPMALLASLMLFVAVIATGLFKLNSAIHFCVSVLVCQIISLSWSPEYMLGLRRIVYDEIPFFSFYFAAEALARANEQRLISILKIYAGAAVIQSALTILFRLTPSAESFFLHSGIARVFINPNSLHEAFELMIINVFGDDKAGGLTIYCNVVGLWGFVSAGIALIVSRYGSKLFWRSIAVLHLLSGIACGSKAALVLLFAVPAMLVVVYARKEIRRPTASQLLVILAGLGAIVIAATAILLDPSNFTFLTKTMTTIATRETMWTFAAEAFPESPMRGLGFGGWSTDFSAWLAAQGYVGTDRFLPPHNGFIYMWSESGLTAVIPAIVAAGLLLWNAYKARRTPGGQAVSVFAFGSYFWLLAQSMGENWNIFGEMHTQAPIAVLLGYASAYVRIGKRKIA